MQGLTDEGAFVDVVCIPVPVQSFAFICSKGIGNSDNVSRKRLFWLLLEPPIPPLLDSIIDSAGNRLAAQVSANSPDKAVNASKNVEIDRNTVQIQEKKALIQVHTIDDVH